MNVAIATFARGDGAEGRTLSVAGELDLATAPELRHELGLLIAEAHSPAVVDLSAVTFLDAAGLSTLVAARREVAGTDVDLVLLDPSPSVRRLLEITDLSVHFEIRESRAGKCRA